MMRLFLTTFLALAFIAMESTSSAWATGDGRGMTTQDAGSIATPQQADGSYALSGSTQSSNSTIDPTVATGDGRGLTTNDPVATGDGRGQTVEEAAEIEEALSIVSTEDCVIVGDTLSCDLSNY